MSNRKHIIPAIGFLAAFIAWTAAVSLIDVQPIGPDGSLVGFATLNRFVHDLTGVHMPLYLLTDWLSLIPAALMASFALLGLMQWISRKSIRRVDASILILGGFYLVVLAAYLFFEQHVINYRPVLINGFLEASYPSSTTMLVLCVMPTAVMQCRERIKNAFCMRCIAWGATAFSAFMVLARLFSGVHWFSDIVGGALLSAALVFLYRAACKAAAR